MADEFLFVYGTLRKETATAMSHLLARYGEFLGAGSMPGRLYEVAGYPGAVTSRVPGDLVVGALYRIVDRERLLPALDEYEECSARFPEPHEYVRTMQLITLDNGESIPAWVYLYQRDVARLHRIVSGDYLDAMQP